MWLTNSITAWQFEEEWAVEIHEYWIIGIQQSSTILDKSTTVGQVDRVDGLSSQVSPDSIDHGIYSQSVVFLSVCLSICLFVCFSVCLSVCQSVQSSIDATLVKTCPHCPA